MLSEIKIYGPQIHTSLEMLVKLSQTLKEHASLKSRVFFHDKAIIGDVDFIFEWKSKPTIVELLELVSLIDKSFIGLKSRYTITTRNERPADIEEIIASTANIAYSLFKFYGPSISDALHAMNSLVDKTPLLREGIIDNKPLTLIGEFDFALQWIRYPETDEIITFLKEVDNILTSSGVWYTVTTKGYLTHKKDDLQALRQFRKDIDEAEGEARKATRFV